MGMARYDYGFRGPRDTTEPRRGTRFGGRYADDFQFGPQRRPPPNRVTAPYNMDYLREQGDRFPRNPYRFGGDWPGQLIGEDEYRYPYITRGGTYISRGSVRPSRYDYRDFGPNFGGRYPDEL
jgi:hypothetical protein